MKRSIGLWQLWGFAVTSLGGTILHFLYDRTGEALLTAPFSGVNESTWEHMKLLFWPMFLYAVVQSFFFRDRNDFWCIKLRGTLIGLSLIPVLFYTYNGAFGKTPDWLNISFFFLSAALAYFVEYLLFSNNFTLRYSWLAFLCLLMVAFLFVIFTFYPPKFPLFQDSLTGQYGVI